MDYDITKSKVLRENFYYQIMNLLDREVVVGEHVVGVNPDCEGKSCSPPIQKFGVEKVVVHENWDSGEKGFVKGMILH